MGGLELRYILGSSSSWQLQGSPIRLSRKGGSSSSSAPLLFRCRFRCSDEWKCQRQLHIECFHRDGDGDGEEGRRRRNGIGGMMLTLALWAGTAPLPSIAAADMLKTYNCLIKECRVELARCIVNPSCAANLACIEACNGRPNDTECQVGCGDLFENSVVDNFNNCVVSQKKCVSQKPDDGSFPVPSPNAIVKKFKLSDFNGKWYISSGLNPTFDTFDCQLHRFSSTSKKLIGNLKWRVKTPDNGFINRSALQIFIQDPNQPGHLSNHDNELLHYQDDWYILSAKIENKLDDYIFIYYRGKNDAWSVYGGAIVYTRTESLPSSIVPYLEKAARKAGIDFSKFQATNNSCQPQPSLLAKLRKTIKEGEDVIIKGAKEIKEKIEKIW